MKKKLASLILTVMMLSIFCVPVQAEDPLKVFVDRRVLSFEVDPIIDNGRVLVPMKAIFEALGALVSWDSETSTATGVKDGITVRLPVGSIFPTINGEAKTLDVPAQIVNGRILAPVRFVGEAFGGSVSWNPNTRSVTINSGIVSVIEYETYTNTKYGYSLPYPNIYDATVESDNGDGVSMETAGGLYRLKMWGAYNINNSSGQDLLAEAKNRVSHISAQSANQNSYDIEYLGGGDGQELVFSEHGFLAGDKIIGLIIMYPSQDKDKFAEVIAHITAGLRD
ncbi:MAG: hypothetical protein CVU90_05075 [Firmicutes bacterium HGW-Firmicutes-15]|nr:MAG: hypothetical protein CVU90_05075 [Firmicutes bacterium HGW-Firmicutes-15]